MILRPVRPASPIGPPMTNLPVGLMCTLVVRRVDVVLLEHRVDDVLLDVDGELRLEIDALFVLARDDDRLDAYGLVVIVVLDGDLGLAVRTQVGQRAVLAHGGQLLGQAVGDRDRQRHELGGLVARVTEHESLVAGALGVERVDRRADAGLFGPVDALGDVGALRVEGDLHGAGLSVEALDRRVVTDLEHPVAGDASDVDVRLRGDLAADQHHAGRHERLRRNAALGVLGEQRVEDAVADLVGNLVRVALSDGLGREQAAQVFLLG